MKFHSIVFIQGSPRSGSSWLAQIFDSSPEVRCKYQPLKSDSFKDRIWVRSPKNDILKFFNEVYDFNDDFLDQKIQKQKGIIQDFQIKADNPKFLVIKMVRYHYLIPHLLELFDNLKVIGIVRHPCGYLNSWRKAPKEFLPEWDFEKEWRFAQNYNRFRPEEYYGFHKWIELAKLFLVMKDKFFNRFCLIQFEDLVNNTQLEVERLFRFCKIETHSQTGEYINASKSIHKDGRPISKWYYKIY